MKKSGATQVLSEESPGVSSLQVKMSEVKSNPWWTPVPDEEEKLWLNQGQKGEKSYVDFILGEE